MADELKSQINVTADVSDAVKGFNEVGEAAKRSSEQIRTAGEEAARGTDKLNEGIERQSAALTRNEKTLANQINRRIQDLQRENAQLQTNSKTSNEYFEALSKQRGVDPGRLTSYLSALQKENDLLKANSAVIEEQAAQQRLLNQARQQAETLNRSRESFIEQLRKESEAIGKTRTELLALKAAELGVSEQAAPFLAQLKATERQFDATGRSVRATTALLRQVPQQFTDIVVSLASGQQPLTVFLQQGGQLKDMFGSAGEAAKALGGYILGLINPFTILAATIGGLALAYYKGSKEAEAFNKAIILSGGTLGVTTSTLVTMTGELSKVGVTQAKAAESLLTFVNTAKIGSANLQEFTRIAIEFERAGGGAAEEVAKQFAKLADEPLKASMALNEAFGFLSFSQAEQIRLLEEQGRKTDAATVAQKAYADALKNATPQLVANIGYIERAWNAVAGATKNAVDTLLNIGRNDLANQLQSARSLLADLTSGSGELSASRQRQVEQLRAQIAGWEAIIAFQQRDAEIKAETARSERERTALRQQFFKDELQYLDNAAKKQREIKAVEDARAKGAINDQEAAARIAQITEKYKDRKKAIDEVAKAQQAYNSVLAKDAGYQTDFIAKWNQINLLLKAGKISMDEMLGAQKALIEQQPFYINNLKEEEKWEKAQLKGREERNKQAEKTIDLIDAEIKKVRDKRIAVELETQGLGLTGEALAEVTKARYDYQIAQVESQIALYAELPLMTQYIDKLREQREELIKLRDASAARDVKKASVKEAQDAEREWKRTADNIEKSLTDALMRGFESGKGFARTLRDTIVNMFKTLVVRPIIQAVVSPIAQGLTGTLGLTGTANAGTSALNTASNLSSLWNAYNGGTAALATSFATSSFGTALGLSAPTAAVFGAEAGIASGVAASGTALTSLGSTLVTVAPYLAAAAAALMVISSLLSEGGGPKTGGSGFASTYGADTSGIDRLFTPSQKDAEAASLAESVITGIQKAAKNYGGTVADFTVGIGFDMDPQGTASNRISSFLSTEFGDILRNIDIDVGRDAAALQQGLGLEVQRLIIAGLQISELPTQISDIFKSIDAATASQETVDAIFKAAEAMNGLLKSAAALKIPMEAITQSMIDAVYGVENLQAGFNAYYANFFSEEEKRAYAMSQLATEFDRIGVAMPTTREGFRALVESIDLTTSEGQVLYGVLLTMSGAFAEVVPAVGAATDALDKFTPISERFANQISTISDSLLGALSGKINADEAAQNISDTLFNSVLEALTSTYANSISESFISGILQPMLDAVVAGSAISASVSQATIDATISQAVERLKVLGTILSDETFKNALGSFQTQLRDALVASGATRAVPETSAGKTQRDKLASDQEAINSQREQLQRRILELEGDTAALRALELQTIDASNRALQERVWALEDEQRISQERAGLERELLQLQGDTVALRELERNALDESNRSLYDQIQALRDAQKIAEERKGLEKRLLELQGDTAALRALERESLDESNRALYDQIIALEDAKSATEGLTNAAGEFVRVWKDIINDLLSEARRIRNIVAVESTMGYAALESRFVIATAQARAGDVEAAKSLAGMGSELISAAGNQVASRLDLIRIQARVASSLEETANVLAGTAPQPEVQTPLDNLVNQNTQMAVVLGEMKTEIVLLKDQLIAIQTNTRRTAEATNGLGESPMLVEVVA